MKNREDTAQPNKQAVLGGAGPRSNKHGISQSQDQQRKLRMSSAYTEQSQILSQIDECYEVSDDFSIKITLNNAIWC